MSLAFMASAVAVGLVGFAGCVHDDPVETGTPPYGTYSVERTVTTWEPSPNFEFASSMTITLDDTRVQTSTDEFATAWSVSGDTISFANNETWHSPEGDGAAYLEYRLAIPTDDTLRGTIAAHVVFDQPSVGSSFDFAFAVDGTRLTR